MAVADLMQSEIEIIKRRGQPVERGTTEYETLRSELDRVGRNVEQYGCLASEHEYRALIELLPEDERECQKKVLETLKD